MEVDCTVVSSQSFLISSSVLLGYDCALQITIFFFVCVTYKSITVLEENV